MDYVALWTGYATMLLGLVTLVLQAGTVIINRIFQNVELKGEFLAFYVARLKARNVAKKQDKKP